MQIGFIGLGKLGLPVAVAIAAHGHTVYGYDVDPRKMARYREGTSGLYEPDLDRGLSEVLSSGALRLVPTLAEAVAPAAIVFSSVQTPHPPELDGSIRFHHSRKDFDYTYLVQSAHEIAEAVEAGQGHKTISIISTVLPGTTRRLVLPALVDRLGPPGEHWGLCYNPSFVAMGQVHADFLRPEFTLIGETTLDSRAGDILQAFYRSLHQAPIQRMRLEEAEAVKVFYNTFIGMKITFANTVMQMCDALQADTDVVLGALQNAHARLISPRYLNGGMGDGGPCHPRDNMALAYISDQMGLRYNLFDFVMTVREQQLEWIADIALRYPLPKVILGETFKPDTNLRDGSPSVLLGHILQERGVPVTFHDPVMEPAMPPAVPSVYIIGTTWPAFQTFPFVQGSVIVDPWGFLKKAPEGVTLVSVGRRR